jgi:hypothetical protein
MSLDELREAVVVAWREPIELCASRIENRSNLQVSSR